jgi:hypothetical protein
LFNIADKRLYAAKRDGRNRVVGAFGALPEGMSAAAPST